MYIHEDYAFRNKITLLSFLMACFVLIRHATNIEVYLLSSGVLYWLQRFMRVFTDLMVPSFFVISGYLFFQNFTYEKLISKWKTRFFSLVVPYLTWNLVAYLYYSGIGMIPCIAGAMNKPIEGFSFLNLANSMLLGGRNVTWFIKFLILFVIISPLAWWLLKRKISGCVLVVILLLAGYWFNYCFVSYLSVFLFGGWIGSSFRDVAKLKLTWQLNVAAFAVVLAMIVTEALYNDIIGGWYYVCRIIQAVLIWLSSDWLAVRGVVHSLLRISFFIYVAHSMILESMEKLFLIVLGNNILGAWLDYIFAPLFTMVIICFAAMVIKRWMPRLWLLINGNRK